MAYATVEDLQSRWRVLNADEEAIAEAKLEDASLLIDVEAAEAGVTLDAKNKRTAALLSLIVCDMVKRAMPSNADQAPVTQGSMSVGPFSESFTYANPMGDLYLTKAEKRRLGIKRSRIGFVGVGGASE